MKRAFAALVLLWGSVIQAQTDFLRCRRHGGISFRASLHCRSSRHRHASPYFPRAASCLTACDT